MAGFFTFLIFNWASDIYLWVFIIRATQKQARELVTIKVQEKKDIQGWLLIPLTYLHSLFWVHTSHLHVRIKISKIRCKHVHAIYVDKLEMMMFPSNA